MKAYTFDELRSLPWGEIKGEKIDGLRDYQLKEVELENNDYSLAIVVQCGDSPPSDRAIITDPARKDQVRHRGFA